ncbi:hypothetical protein LB823_01295 [Tsukamurella sp. M9C]|uniref:hypothetical protein n=1 Tax=unclassified Tsukamurella TaxID=2633480 RepID=UPI001CCDDBDC|nr:hypothetical protein [Tsukamurella sp. M9C]MCA0154823.1 hypothetical protein [Tsukamurella sp. M9C]
MQELVIRLATGRQIRVAADYNRSSPLIAAMTAWFIELNGRPGAEIVVPVDANAGLKWFDVFTWSGGNLSIPDHRVAGENAANMQLDRLLALVGSMCPRPVLYVSIPARTTEKPPGDRRFFRFRAERDPLVTPPTRVVCLIPS